MNICFARACAALAASAIMSTLCLAQTVFTANTTINDGDFTFDGQDITIRGCTVTINGAHAFNSIILERNASNQAGVLTHTPAFTNASLNGVALTVTNDVTIQGVSASLVASRIDLTAKGHLTGTGFGAGGNSTNDSGGGGHGGAGGDSNLVLGGGTYGSFTAPTDFGSAGGNAGGTSTGGGAGGGALRLIIGGTLTIDGSILADGQSSSTSTNGWRGGGGAGGSIHISTGSLSGAGVISAKGGGRFCCDAGGGGGGRIAVDASASTFTGSMLAHGGDGRTDGGAGTVFSVIGAATPTLRIDNNGQLGETTEMTGSVAVTGNLIVTGNAILGPTHQDASLQLDVSGNITIDPGAAIGADFRGFASGSGPSAGGNSTNDSGGGGHGGAGGDSNLAAGGGTYDSITAPTEMGSGGGNAGNSDNGGGRGGGAFSVSCGGTITLNGEISADGEGGTTSNPGGWRGGGGAGGAIRVTCGTLEGSGAFTAHGGYRFCCSAGGGGGGRIAISYTTSTFTGVMGAFGGDGFVDGGAGTVYYKPASSRGTLIIDNNGQAGETTELSGSITLDANLIVRNAAILGPDYQDPTLALSFGGDVTVEATAAIGADTRGYPSGTGSGAAESSTTDSGGGGHGGAGGDSNLTAGGGTYGSITAPTEMGSGGGHAGGLDNGGGRGGGAFSLQCDGTLTVIGEITADGQSSSRSTNNWRGGGGAGGSLRIDCGTLAGSGAITAHGGNRYCCDAGGGGGGRIAINYTTSSFTGIIGAYGGDGLFDGGAGTVFLKPASARGTLIIDNNGTLGETTEMTGEVTLDADLVVRNAGILGPTHQDPTMRLSLGGNATVESNGFISATGRGYASGEGPGAGGNSTADSGGGGYGGAGGNSNLALGGPANGDKSNPVLMGSGGGKAGGQTSTANPGGGVINLDIAGTLTVNGAITSHGLAGLAPNGWRGGGGAGGSIFLRAGTLDGSGSITAAGGNRFCCNAGGGGGGRIAVYSCNVLMSPANITAPGGDGLFDGQNGSVYFGSSSINIFLQPDSTSYTGGDEVSLVVDAIGDGDVTFQWRREGVPVVDDGRITGAQTQQLTLSPIDCADGGIYDCLVTDSCGSFPTQPAMITVLAPSDYDQSGFVDIDDFVAFVTDFELGADEADFDQSGFVDLDDFIAFVYAFEAGC